MCSSVFLCVPVCGGGGDDFGGHDFGGHTKVLKTSTLCQLCANSVLQKKRSHYATDMEYLLEGRIAINMSFGKCNAS